MYSSLKTALPMEFEVRLLELPQGEDPDSWSLKLGSEGFRKLLFIHLNGLHLYSTGCYPVGIYHGSQRGCRSINR